MQIIPVLPTPLPPLDSLRAPSIYNVQYWYPRYGAVCPGTFQAFAHDWGQVLTFRVIYQNAPITEGDHLL
jgi:hypothetical protein